MTVRWPRALMAAVMAAATVPARADSPEAFPAPATIAAQAPAANDGGPYPPEVTAEVDRGLDRLYNLDHAAARKVFEGLAKKYPDNPVGSYGLTMALWWELTNEYDENNPDLEKQFLAAADRTIALARPMVKAGDPTGNGRLCLGGALGLKARWDGLQGKWMSAYRSGKQAFEHQEKAIKLHPELYDAYLGVGIFHYYVAVLPAAVKLFAKMIFGGNKQQGLDEINIARKKGRFSKTAAQLFLVGIYLNNEKDPATALALLREARAQYPQSPFFQVIEMIILEQSGDWLNLRLVAEDFLAKTNAEAAYYTRNREHIGLFMLANSYMIEGEHARAMDLFDRVVANHPRQDRWITWTYLNRGKTHDLRGRRDLALADYKTVMRRRDVWGLHDKARALQRNAYTPPEK